MKYFLKEQSYFNARAFSESSILISKGQLISKHLGILDHHLAFDMVRVHVLAG